MISATYRWSMKLTTLLSVLWTWLASLLTKATPKPARCSLSRSSTSATETLKVFLTRSLIRRTTLRLPFKLSLPGMCRSMLQTPMTMDLALRGELFGDLLAHKRLDDITTLNVGEALQPDAAFVATAHFVHILLEAAERGNTPLIHHDIVAQQSALGVAGDGPLGDVAASDDADAWDMIELAHLGTAHDMLGHLRLQQTFERRSHVADQIVNDGI